MVLGKSVLPYVETGLSLTEDSWMVASATGCPTSLWYTHAIAINYLNAPRSNEHTTSQEGPRYSYCLALEYCFLSSSL